MLAQLRATVRDSLPSKIVHAYRVIRHTLLWPTELEMVAARQFLSPETIAVDVGANFGIFTSVLARHSKKVFAFEPNPTCARHLRKVLPANCEIIAKAVSDRTGTTTLRMPLGSGVAMDALATIAEGNRFDSEERATGVLTLKVETTTLDETLLAPAGSASRVAFVNVDAEGHEFAVLRGSEGLLAAHRPVLLLELEFRHGAPVDDVFTWLNEQRYWPYAFLEGFMPIDSASLRALQDESRLSRRLLGDRRSGYINNVFFLPEG